MGRARQFIEPRHDGGMGNELVNTSSLAEKVRERIQATFVELIPEDAWKKMVESEIERFTTDTRNYNGDVPSPLRQMIQQQVRERMQVLVKQALDSPEFAPKWENNKHMAADAVRTIVVEKAPEIFGAIFSQGVQDILNNMKR